MKNSPWRRFAYAGNTIQDYQNEASRKKITIHSHLFHAVKDDGGKNYQQ